MHSTTEIPATLGAVSRFTQSLESKLADVSIEARTRIILAIQELCVNIVEHAFAGDPGTIHIDVRLNKNHIEFEMLDNARQGFSPPSEIEEPDPLALPEDGLGLFIIYQSFDEVQYSRLDTGNHWRLATRF